MSNDLSKEELIEKNRIIGVVNKYIGQLLDNRARYDGRYIDYSGELLEIGKPAIPFLLPYIISKKEVAKLVEEMGGMDVAQVIELLQAEDESIKKNREKILLYIQKNPEKYGDALNNVIWELAENDESLEIRLDALITLAELGDLSVKGQFAALKDDVLALGTPNEDEDGLIKFPSMKEGNLYSALLHGSQICGDHATLIELLEKVDSSHRSYTAFVLSRVDQSPELLQRYKELLDKELATDLKYNTRIENLFLAIAENSAPVQDRLDVMFPALEFVKKEKPSLAPKLEKIVERVSGSVPGKGESAQKKEEKKKWQFWKK